jgi:hypothetical protein
LIHLQKITLGEMRDSGMRGILIYCADYHCSHSLAISGDRWPDDVRLSDIEDRFTCTVCGKHGADLRPDFNWNRKQVSGWGIGRERPNVSSVSGDGPSILGGCTALKG